MRRRICLFGIEDVTAQPYAWKDVRLEPDTGSCMQILALYDDALWERLEKARAEVNRLEHEVRAAAKHEPLDEVEVALVAEHDILEQRQLNRDESGQGSGYFVRKNDSIRARAIAHAKTLQPPSAQKTLTPEAKKHMDALIEKYKPRLCPQCDGHCPVGQCFSRPA